MRVSGGLTFGEGLLEAFPVDMSQNMVRLPVEMSEGQLTEELFAGKRPGRHQPTHYKV